MRDEEQSFLCGAEQRYVRVPLLSRWMVTWPFMRLVLEPEAFVLRPVRGFRWLGTRRFAYESVAEVRVRGERYSRAFLRFADAGEGALSVTTFGDGARLLAERLDARGVPARDLRRL